MLPVVELGPVVEVVLVVAAFPELDFVLSANSQFDPPRRKNSGSARIQDGCRFPVFTLHNGQPEDFLRAEMHRRFAHHGDCGE